MRLWTIHPSYLDVKGLTAAWREGLLAQKVLAGETRGYRHHPQLLRFRAHAHPLQAVGVYLRALHEEASRRGYHFDATKILHSKETSRIEETHGQLLYEWSHLRAKLKLRAPLLFQRVKHIAIPMPHPLFGIIDGGVRPSENLRLHAELAVRQK